MRRATLPAGPPRAPRRPRDRRRGAAPCGEAPTGRPGRDGGVAGPHAGPRRAWRASRLGRGGGAVRARSRARPQRPLRARRRRAPTRRPARRRGGPHADGGHRPSVRHGPAARRGSVERLTSWRPVRRLPAPPTPSLPQSRSRLLRVNRLPCPRRPGAPGVREPTTAATAPPPRAGPTASSWPPSRSRLPGPRGPRQRAAGVLRGPRGPRRVVRGGLVATSRSA